MCMAVSFVDWDMIMHYLGGGVGHLKNTPPQQVHRSGPADPDSEEIEVEGKEGDTSGNIREDPQDIIMNNGELEVGKDDKEKRQDDETNDDDNDDDDDESDDEEEEDKDKDKESAHLRLYQEN